MTSSPRTLPLAPLLHAIARELGGPRSAILWAEGQMTRALCPDEGALQSSQDLQGLDLAVQTLDNLGRTLARLADSLPAGLGIDPGPALEVLTLERLSMALLAAAGAEVPPPSLQPRIELF